MSPANCGCCSSSESRLMPLGKATAACCCCADSESRCIPREPGSCAATSADIQNAKLTKHTKNHHKCHELNVFPKEEGKKYSTIGNKNSVKKADTPNDAEHSEMRKITKIVREPGLNVSFSQQPNKRVSALQNTKRIKM